MPHLVAEALAGLLLASYTMEALGYEVTPLDVEPPRDSVLAVRLGDPELLLAFCRSVQAGRRSTPTPGPNLARSPDTSTRW